MNNIQEIENGYGDLFGYAEMYEWSFLHNPDEYDGTIGKLVQFDENNTDRIKLAENSQNIVGITSVKPAFISTNPTNWPYKYAFNKFGDLFLEEKEISQGVKKYDIVNEIHYIDTFKTTIYTPILSNIYDKEKKYVKREFRPEWAKITLLGKAIIKDDGTCKEGKYCTIYSGNDKKKYGTVTLANGTEDFKLYVLCRLSNDTILVFYSPKI